jgi:hypothetical protein
LLVDLSEEAEPERFAAAAVLTLLHGAFDERSRSVALELSEVLELVAGIPRERVHPTLQPLQEDVKLLIRESR